MNAKVKYRGYGEDALVGRLRESGGQVYFQYDPEWRERGLELSPFVLPLSETRAVAPRGKRFHGLFPVFADSLPDWWGEKLMRRYFSAIGRDWRDLTALDKLCFQGARTMGALACEPDTGKLGGQSRLELSELADAAEATLSGDAVEVMGALLQSGHSAGGAQPKVVLGLSPDRRTVVSGEGELPEGFEHWLVKFDLEPVLEDGRTEAACCLAARAAGIDVPETAVLEDGAGRAHFAVRRFDRLSDGRRVHMQSYSALADLPVSEPIDYSDMMDVVRELVRDQKQIDQLFRRAVFNVMLGNDDDHGKNHSFLMDSRGVWSLAPAYDIIQGAHPLGGGMRACGVRGRMAEVRRGDLLSLAELHGVANPAGVIEEVGDVLSRIREFGEQAGLSDRGIDELKQGIRDI